MPKQNKKAKKSPRSNKQLVFIAFGITVLICTMVFGGIFIREYLQEREHQTKLNTEQPIKEDGGGYSGKELKTKIYFGMASYTVIIPDGWKVDKMDSLGIIFADKLDYKPGTPFEFVAPDNSRIMSRFALNYQDTGDMPKEYDGYKKTDYSNGQLSGYLLYHEFSPGEKYSLETMKGGEKKYAYYLIDGDTTWVITYLVLHGDADQHELVEKVVRSLRVQGNRQL